jgi:HD-like signal output (HDOD) protein
MNLPATETRPADLPPQRDASAAAFEFVRELAVALSSGDVQLPSFPDVSARVQRALGDENASVEHVVRIVGSEPILASRVITLANSVAMNPAGTPINELRTAVARLGFDNLRSTAITFAMTQLRRAADYRDIEKPLSALWQRSVHMAALCFVIARHTGRINADMALLAGLVHGVGKVYILASARRYPALCADQMSYQALVRDWHGNVARGLLESWHFPEEIVAAVHTFEDAERESRGASLADVLEVADLLIVHRDRPDELAACVQESKAAAQISLDGTSCAALMRQSVAEIKALMQVLGH